jgi:hypothetical protein
VLELVKNGKLILNVIFESIKSARCFHEFIIIINNAASSISHIKKDIEQMLAVAEVAISEIHNAIIKASTQLLPDLGPQIEPALLAELPAALVAASQPNPSKC